MPDLKLRAPKEQDLSTSSEAVRPQRIIYGTATSLLRRSGKVDLPVSSWIAVDKTVANQRRLA